MPLPIRVTQYLPELSAAAQLYNLDQNLLAAIVDRETLWGTSKDLDKLGPGGTGDFGKRNPARWGSALPPDGRGWGRGLGQIDFGGHKDWCLQKTSDGSMFLWEDPGENLKQAAGILHANITALGQIDAAVAAYNAGAGSVFRALQPIIGNYDPDVRRAALDGVTTGHDYVTWVLQRRDQFAIV